MRYVAGCAMARNDMRKTLKIEGELLGALRQFAADSGRTLDDLGHEAVGLLLKKHCRPRSLQEALKMSLRSLPLNDNGPAARKRAR